MPQYSTNPKRFVRWFDRVSDALVGEIELQEVNDSKLHELFGVAATNPMFDCYPIKSTSQIRYIQELIKQTIDVKIYDYFIECDSV